MNSILSRCIDYAALAAGRIMVFPLVVLPDGAALRVAKGYVWLLFRCMPRLEKVAKTNLALVFPDKSAAEHDVIFRKSVEVLAENVLGFARIPTLNKQKAAAMCNYAHASETMRRLRKQSNGVGVLIPTIHFDAFEYFIQIHALNHGPVSILGRGFGMPAFDRWWNGRRQTFGNEIFDRKGGYSEIARRLKKGEDIVVLCDQNVKANHAIFANFFGVPAATTKTVALAALRTGAPIMFGCPVQIAEGEFEVTAQEILHPSAVEGTMEEKLLQSTEALHREFEKQILRRPEAWFWIHRRWKTRPNGEKERIY